MFVRDAWYVAAWLDDVGDVPLRRIILDEPVVIFRAGGAIAALADRCPHRLVPLSLGSVVDGALACAYHGLRFDGDGACVHNPHGPTIPPGAGVRAYPVVVNDGAVWIWTGRAERADRALVPDLPSFGDAATFRLASGHVRVAADYRLIADNLLDLSHVEFLHPGLRSPDGAEQKREVRQEGTTLWSLSWRIGTLPNVPMQRYWPAGKRGDAHAHMRWQPPAAMLLDVGMGECGRPDSEARSRLSAHLLTPETETSTHYFWAFRCRADAPDEVASARAIGVAAFEREDAPVIEAQQRNVRDGDRANLDRGLLASDSAAIRARHILRDLVRADAQGRSTGGER